MLLKHQFVFAQSITGKVNARALRATLVIHYSGLRSSVLETLKTLSSKPHSSAVLALCPLSLTGVRSANTLPNKAFPMCS